MDFDLNRKYAEQMDRYCVQNRNKFALIGILALMVVRSFLEEQLRGICGILADTKEGLTNTEIDQLLRQADIHFSKSLTSVSPYVYSTISKRERLFKALSERQVQDGCGNNIANFIQIAMNPVRYVQVPEQFETIREKLNKVLSFSGLNLNERGKLGSVTPATTIPEAERRASRLRQFLVERNTHQDVLAFCRPELIEDNYFHAVLEATKSVAEKIRKKAGVNGDGASLVEEVFGLEKNGKPRIPILAFNALSNETEISEHRGLINLLKGLFGTFRNVTAHAPKLTWTINEQDALDLFSLASFLHRRIDFSRVMPNR